MKNHLRLQLHHLPWCDGTGKRSTWLQRVVTTLTGPAFLDIYAGRVRHAVIFPAWHEEDKPQSFLCENSRKRQQRPVSLDHLRANPRTPLFTTDRPLPFYNSENDSDDARRPLGGGRRGDDHCLA